MNIPHSIFKAYDIRGIVNEQLNETLTEKIGQAIATQTIRQGQTALCVGRDGRLSGTSLSAALIRGILKTGVHVIDVGQVTTPMLYFAAHHFNTCSGVMVTGSHNPPNYNGFKILIANKTLAGEAILELKHLIETGDLIEDSAGVARTQDIKDAYFSHILNHIQLERPITLAIDSGNGIAGKFAPELFRALGCQVIELYSEVDGNFPNHHPDPSRPENLNDLIETLQQSDAQLGLAFDGDGDRLGVVTKDGKIIYPDRQLLLFARDILQRHQGANIIYDVKSTQRLNSWIREHGGKPILCRTGHSFIKAKMKETGALLAGEMSGHIFFKERWFGFDDGLYAGVRLLEILSREHDPSQTLNALPQAISTPEINIQMDDAHAFIDTLQTAFDRGELACPEGTKLITLDGLRIEYPFGFGLIRASNTTPILVLRFEAQTHEQLLMIQNEFRTFILAQRATLNLPF